MRIVQNVCKQCNTSFEAKKREMFCSSVCRHTHDDAKPKERDYIVTPQMIQPI